MITHPCHIHIDPRKEEDIAFIKLVLDHETWDEYGQLVQRIEESMAIQQPLILDQKVDERELHMTVQYHDQETALTLVSSLLNQAGITIGKKKIHIAKLGGWFDL